jgi:diguanylate cyclase (GGDEF)-like protein
MLIVLITVVSIYYGNYKNTVEIIRSEYKAKIKLIEQSIYNETKYTKIISKIIEEDISNLMEENSKKIVEKYKEDPNFLDWDFKEMRSEIDNMDIYILNKDLKVIFSSIKEEIGLNLSVYPDFAKLLQKRLSGSKFESDTINFSILEAELKKYSYMPTPDNKYLIELSVTIEDSYPAVKDLNIVYLSKDLKEDYPFIEDIRVYKFNNDKEYSHELDTMVDNPMEAKISKEVQDKYVKLALETDRIQEQVIEGKDNNFRLKYIPYTTEDKAKKLNWWQSYVIEIMYDDKIVTDEIKDQKRVFLRNMAIVSILYLGFSFIIIYLIRKNREIAYKDPLTKLPNRKRFEEVMKNEMARVNRKDNNKIAILFFDLDKFKTINDKFGHKVGDKVLKEVGNKIGNELRKGDIVSRLGGDEFIVLITDVKSIEDAIEVADRMSEVFKEKLSIDLKEISIRPSIGISLYPDHGKTIEELILKADDAMYEAKQKQLGYKIYEEDV